MRTWASLSLSAISIQQPACWHTAVTVPSVRTTVCAYFAVACATSASGTIGDAPIGAPNRVAARAAAAEALGAGAKAACVDAPGAPA